MVFAVALCISTAGSVSAASTGNNSANTTNITNTGLANTSCPEYQINSSHTGQSNYKGPQTNTTKWTYKGITVYGSAVIGSSGTIYVGSYSGKLYAFNPNGTVKWTYTTASNILGSPAVGKDGTIYISDWYNSTLYAINPNGTLKWAYNIGYCNYGSSTVIGSNGIIYIPVTTDTTGILYAINSTNGKVKWTYNTGAIYGSSAAIGSNGTIYIADSNGVLYAINPSGSLKWSYTLNYENKYYQYFSVTLHYDTPSIGPDGTIYIGTNGGSYTALFAVTDNGDTGTVKWTYPSAESIHGLGESLYGAPAVSSNGIIYIVGNSTIYAINSTTGTLLWTYSTGGTATDETTSVTIGSDGTIYFGSSTGLYALKSNGTLKWRYATGEVCASPTIGSDGTLYIGSMNNGFYALNDLAADFKANNASISSPLTVHFISSSTGTPKSWKWNFGDGTTSTTQNPTHTYSKAGDYTVTLIVTLSNGATVTKIKIIDLTAPNVTISPSEGNFSATQTVTLKASDDSGSATSYYTTDGSDPRTSSTRHVYTSAIVLNSTTKINYAAVDLSGNWSPVYSKTYTQSWPETKIVINVQNASYYHNESLSDQIQSILDNATPGSTVKFLGKEYGNLHLTINKKLNIITYAGTKITASNSSPVFSINGLQASGTQISGFTIINTGPGILINNTSSVTLLGDRITSTGGSAVLINRSSKTLINDTYLTNSVTGANILGGDNTTIINSQITNNSGQGITLQDASNVNINNNTINSNGDGILISGSAINITIESNTIERNYNGLDMEYNNGQNITIKSNLMAVNYCGIEFGSGYKTAKGESIKHNVIYGSSWREIDAMPAFYDDLQILVGSNVYGLAWSGNDPFNVPSVGSSHFCCKIAAEDAILKLSYDAKTGTYTAGYYDPYTGELMSDLPPIDITFTLPNGSTVVVRMNNGKSTFSSSQYANELIGELTASFGSQSSTTKTPDGYSKAGSGHIDGTYNQSNGDGSGNGPGGGSGNGNGPSTSGSNGGSGGSGSSSSNGASSGSTSSMGLLEAASAAESAAGQAGSNGQQSSQSKDTKTAKELFVDNTAKIPEVWGIIGIIVLLIAAFGAYYRKDLMNMVKKSRK